MTKKKKIIVGLIIAGLLVSWFIYKKKSATGKVEYQTAKVEKTTLVQSVSLSGQVLNGNLMTITTQTSGLVKKVYLQEGQRIWAGQKIAEVTLDQAGQQKNLQTWSSYLSARNNLDSAQTSLYTLQSQMFSANQKFMNDAVARNLATNDPTYIQQNADWLASEAKYKNQQSVIQQAQVAVSNAYLSYQQTSSAINAPISGAISNLNLVEGMLLASQTDTTTANNQLVAVIKNNQPALLKFNLSEIEVLKIKVGQKATVTFDSLGEKTFTGQVMAVDKIGSVSNNVVNYSTVLKLDTVSEEILANMSANAQIIITSKSEILVVPSTALQNLNGQNYVQILKNKQPQQQSVEIGISSDSQTEITNGLTEGEEIVIGTVSSAATTSSGTSVFSRTGLGGGAFRTGGR